MNWQTAWYAVSTAALVLGGASVAWAWTRRHSPAGVAEMECAKAEQAVAREVAALCGTVGALDDRVRVLVHERDEAKVAATEAKAAATEAKAAATEAKAAATELIDRVRGLEAQVAAVLAEIHAVSDQMAGCPNLGPDGQPPCAVVQTARPTPVRGHGGRWVKALPEVQP